MVVDEAMFDGVILDVAGALAFVTTLEGAALEADGIDAVSSLEGVSVVVNAPIEVTVALTVATGVEAGGALTSVDVSTVDVIVAALTEAPPPRGAIGSVPSPQPAHRAA